MNDEGEVSLEDKVSAKLFGSDESEESEGSNESENISEENIEQSDEQPNEESAGLEVVDFDGKQYQLPTELRDALLRQSDYTRKSQEVADLRRSVELKAKAIADVEAFGNSIRKESSEIQTINAQLEQYKGLDWAQMTAEQMYLAKHNMDLLKEKRQELQGTVQSKQQEFLKQRDQKRQELIGETVKYLGTQNKGWSDKNGEELTGYVKNLGFQQDSMMSMFTDPVLTNALWKAKQWDDLQSKKGEITKKVTGVPPVVKPGPSTPEMSAKMKGLNLQKQMKSAKTNSEKVRIARDIVASRFLKDL